MNIIRIGNTCWLSADLQTIFAIPHIFERLNYIYTNRKNPGFNITGGKLVFIELLLDFISNYNNVNAYINLFKFARLINANGELHCEINKLKYRAGVYTELEYEE